MRQGASSATDGFHFGISYIVESGRSTNQERLAGWPAWRLPAITTSDTTHVGPDLAGRHVLAMANFERLRLFIEASSPTDQHSTPNCCLSIKFEFSISGDAEVLALTFGIRAR